MRLWLVSFFIFYFVQAGISQHVIAEKLGASLKLFLNNEKTDQRFVSLINGQAYAAVFIETSPGYNPPPDLVRIRTRTVTIATADILLSRIMEVAALPQVKRIDLPLLFVKTDSLMKRLVGVNKIHSGIAPLDRGYSGKNCVIGIIDDGIDITHPDFDDSMGYTRVDQLWNMDFYGKPPAGYQYGHVWTSDSIELYKEKYREKQKSSFEMQTLFGYGGHGTPVSGLAAGKNGIAPGSVIDSVALTAFQDTLLRSDRIIDAIAFIYSRAKALNKKCVINISLGAQDGAPHDGKSLIETAIDEFSSDKQDLLIAVSAGNNGNNWKHWAALPVHKDSSFGFFRCAYEGKIYFSFPRKFSDSLKISITESMSGDNNALHISKDSIFYQTPFVTLSSLISQTSPVQFNSFQKNGVISSIITFSGAHANEDYDELVIKVQEFTSGTNGNIFDDHLYRFIFKGTGEVHGWYPFWNLHPIFFFGDNPYPSDSTFINTDNEYSTNIPSHAFTVISSGAYNTRNCYLRKVNNEVVGSYATCQLTYFTSHGPTLDGRIKPDILSPGENVLAPRSVMDNFLEHHFIIDTMLQAFSGTSASSPITAGVTALLWEYNPEFTRADIINRIKSTAYSDNFTASTGALPNNISGWGKIDAYKALTGESTDLARNCIDLNCQRIDIVPDPVPDYSTSFRLFPNPASGTVVLEYRSSLKSQAAFYNSLGQTIKVVALPVSMVLNQHSVLLNGIPPGIYFVRFFNQEKSIIKKIFVR